MELGLSLHENIQLTTSNLGIAVLMQVSIENSITDLITNLVCNRQQSNIQSHIKSTNKKSPNNLHANQIVDKL